MALNHCAEKGFPPTHFPRGAAAARCAGYFYLVHSNQHGLQHRCTLLSHQAFLMSLKQVGEAACAAALPSPVTPRFSWKVLQDGSTCCVHLYFCGKSSLISQFRAGEHLHAVALPGMASNKAYRTSTCWQGWKHLTENH